MDNYICILIGGIKILYQKIFKEIYLNIISKKLWMNAKHWVCNLKNNTCIGCGTIICPICLQEPFDCKCENKDNCCKIPN